MRFLVDNQLPVALARFLKANGLDAEHVLDLGLDEAKDEEIWRYVDVQEMVLLSKDEDFLHLAARYPGKAAVVWIRLGNCRKRELLDRFEIMLPQLLTALAGGERVVEMR